MISKIYGVLDSYECVGIVKKGRDTKYWDIGTFNGVVKDGLAEKVPFATVRRLWCV